MWPARCARNRLLVPALLLIACRTAPIVDAAKVVPYTAESEDHKYAPYPYAAAFSRAGHTVMFVAAEHVSCNGCADGREHPTMRTVAWAMETAHPDVVVVEGLRTGAEMSPPSIVKSVDACTRERFVHCGESLYAIERARAAGVPYVTGEPTDAEVLRAARRDGYSEMDIVGFYVVRQVPQLHREGKAVDEARIRDLLKSFARYLGIAAPAPEAFADWFRAHAAGKAIADIQGDDLAPLAGQKASFFQQISHQISLTRNRTMAERVSMLLGRYRTVLVVYGGSHILNLQPALEAAFGPAVFSKPF
jgi:hypothetical protein